MTSGRDLVLHLVAPDSISREVVPKTTADHMATAAPDVFGRNLCTVKPKGLDSSPDVVSRSLETTIT